MSLHKTLHRGAWSRLLLLAMLQAPLCAACSDDFGRDFTPPNAASLALGRTSPGDVLAVEGLPFQHYTTTIDIADKDQPGLNGRHLGGLYDVFKYDYTTKSGFGSPGRRAALFIFWNQKLAGWTYNSNLAADSTDFDAAGARAFLTKGLSEEAVVQHFGQPDGRFGYPWVAKPGTFMYQYEYYVGRNDRTQTKLLRLWFDQSGRLLDYKLAVNDAPMQVSAPSTMVVVPIIVHR